MLKSPPAPNRNSIKLAEPNLNSTSTNFGTIVGFWPGGLSARIGPEVKNVKITGSTERTPLGLREVFLWPSLALMALATILGIAISWRLVGGNPEVGVRAIIPHLVAWFALFLAFPLLVSRMSHRLALQLERLNRAVEQVAAGHHQERVEVQGSREMRHLASAFNNMAEALEESRSREVGLLEETSQMQAVRELDRLKTDFLATISHELRTPLTLIMGYAELISSREKLSPAGQEMAQTALRESQRMACLVDDLLDVSRIETGGLELHSEPVNLVRLIEESLARFRALSPLHNLEARVPQGVPWVMADKARISQAVDNLLDNAVKYSPDGGTITVEVLRQSVEIMVRVEDHGVGISPEKQKLLFTKFYRADDFLKLAIRGTGVGLVLCKHIVEAHGGHIWVESEQGLGSTFSFTLPVYQNAAASQSRSVTAPAPQQQPPVDANSQN